MLKQFPPSDHGQDGGGSADGLGLIETSPGDHDGQPDLVRDTLWTYENLARKGVTPKDAPSLGAWSLLNWARENRNHFFERMLPKAMAAGEKKAEHCEQQIGEGRGLKYIEKQVEDMALKWERDAVADMDGTIKKTVTAQMSDWER